MGMPKHLSASDIEEFGREMDAIRNEIADSLGSKDRAYILSVIKWQRSLMLAGRIVVFLSFFLLPMSDWTFTGWPQFWAVQARSMPPCWQQSVKSTVPGRFSIVRPSQA